VSKVRWDIGLAVVGAASAIVGLFTDFTSAIEDVLYIGGFAAMIYGLSTWASRRRRLRNVPPPPVPVEPSEP
jgi:hypothetical protein